MLAEAGDRAGAESVALAARVAAAAPPGQALRAMLGAYLSQEHIAAIEVGCPVAALGSEMPRQAPEVRRAATVRIKEMIDLVRPPVARLGPARSARASLVTVAHGRRTMLARAVDEPALSDALRAATLAHFTTDTG